MGAHNLYGSALSDCLCECALAHLASSCTFDRGPRCKAHRWRGLHVRRVCERCRSGVWARVRLQTWCLGALPYRGHKSEPAKRSTSPLGGEFLKSIWPPMALRIGLLRSSALQNDGRITPVILQCRTPQETNPKGHWGPIYFFIKSLFLLPPCTQSWYTHSYDL